MKQITPEDLRNLTDGNADIAARVEALNRLAYWEKGKYDHLEPTIAGLLHDPSAFIRGGAIKTLLAGWYRDGYVDQAAEILRMDRDEDWTARADAAFALAQYTIRTGKHHNRIVGELVRALLQDQDSAVQERSYQELLRVLAPERDAYAATGEFDRDRDVDWDLLRPYMTE